MTVTGSKARHGRIAYSGGSLHYLAMPMGGIGAGQVSLCGDGSLRQWQLFNQVNHLAFVPDSFFAIRASSVEPAEDQIRILLSEECASMPAGDTPMVNDNWIPPGQRLLLEGVPGIERTKFNVEYPFAHVKYEDAALPVEVELEAWSPFIPLDPDDSGLPAVLFTFTIENPKSHRVHGCLGATMQNAIGWDGVAPIDGNQCYLYGGNVNSVAWQENSVSLVMTNPSLSRDDSSAGELVLRALDIGARPFESWTRPQEFVRMLEGFRLPHYELENPENRPTGRSQDLRSSYENRSVLGRGASAPGTTWNGGIVVPFDLASGECKVISFTLTWYFPNRYVNFDQFGLPRDYGRSRFWLGNSYARRFESASEVADYVVTHRERLEAGSRAWADTWARSSLPLWALETVANQAATIRSPTCFRSADGRFFAFEGCLGASTANWNAGYGGSCPLNCTHVWNYEQAMSRLFPGLERNMRQTDFEIVQAPEGYIPHRTYAPAFLPQYWDQLIGGPDDPALDGMLGTILKTYREVRGGADPEWLVPLWPRVRRLIDWIIARWDPDHDGVLRGKQPNTYDISFYGPNMYIGCLWLAAVRAAEELALLSHEGAYAHDLNALFRAGSRSYDEMLWNGEYYIQAADDSTPEEHQYGSGCLSDQLFGQWWAHLLELGYVLPREHVVECLRCIVRYNFREGFREFKHGDRVFADEDDAGLVLCSWPHGGRPTVPVRYSNEVWTGVEYQVGAHCIMEGLTAEGETVIGAIRQRYSGMRRNPFNEIENGDHYARSLAGWSCVDALTGFRYNALEARMRFAPRGSSTSSNFPFVGADGWGSFEHFTSENGSCVRLRCRWGEVSVRSLILDGVSAAGVRAAMNDHEVDCDWVAEDGGLEVRFASLQVLCRGDSLVLEMT